MRVKLYTSHLGFYKSHKSGRSCNKIFWPAYYDISCFVGQSSIKKRFYKISDHLVRYLKVGWTENFSLPSRILSTRSVQIKVGNIERVWSNFDQIKFNSGARFTLVLSNKIILINKSIQNSEYVYIHWESTKEFNWKLRNFVNIIFVKEHLKI